MTLVVSVISLYFLLSHRTLLVSYQDIVVSTISSHMLRTCFYQKSWLVTPSKTASVPYLSSLCRDWIPGGTTLRWSVGCVVKPLWVKLKLRPPDSHSFGEHYISATQACHLEVLHAPPPPSHQLGLDNSMILLNSGPLVLNTYSFTIWCFWNSVAILYLCEFIALWVSIVLYIVDRYNRGFINGNFLGHKVLLLMNIPTRQTFICKMWRKHEL